jgi:hypothetical protein
MKQRTASFLLIIGALMQQSAQAARPLLNIKDDIVALAKAHQGEGDPQQLIQQQLQVLIDELLQGYPQPPIKERLTLLQGAWYQEWGPYDYRNNRRGVDPDISTDQIYQVVFAEGYYYNVNPMRDSEKIALLRGEYLLAGSGYPDTLNVKFTAFPGYRGAPTQPLWELPQQAETKQLASPTTIVPALIVKLFFGGGSLREIYTDDTLRLTYGSDSPEGKTGEYLYVLTRVVP